MSTGQGGDEAWGDGLELILVPTDIWKYWLGIFKGVSRCLEFDAMLYNIVFCIR